MKLGTHMQGPKVDAQNKFRGYSPFNTFFTPHMCGVQGHLSKNVNIAIYQDEHFKL